MNAFQLREDNDMKHIISKLTERNKDTFFTRLTNEEVGVVFTYSMNFLYHDVAKLAIKHGVLIEYCNRETSEYKKFGAFTCKIAKVNVTPFDLLRREIDRLMEYKEEQYKKEYSVHALDVALRHRNQISQLEDVLIIIRKIEEDMR
jgi:hypothetical protein